MWISLRKNKPLWSGSIGPKELWLIGGGWVLGVCIGGLAQFGDRRQYENLNESRWGTWQAMEAQHTQEMGKLLKEYQTLRRKRPVTTGTRPWRGRVH